MEESKAVFIDESTDISQVRPEDLEIIEGVCPVPSVAQVCMAILMKHSEGLFGQWKAGLEGAPVEMVDALQLKLYRKGYLQKDAATNQYKLSSRGQYVLAIAAKEVGLAK